MEAINKTIKHNLKTKLGDLKGKWMDELLEVLWAYRITVRTPTGETPFSLSYGFEAMIPVEIVMSLLRRKITIKIIITSCKVASLISLGKSKVTHNNGLLLTNDALPNISTLKLLLEDSK